MLILGQVRLSKGWLCPARLKFPAGARTLKITPSQIMYNNSRSSNKPEGAPDPIFVLLNLDYSRKEKYIIGAVVMVIRIRNF